MKKKEIIYIDTIQVECSECNGYGYFNNSDPTKDDIPCDVCDGTGEVEVDALAYCENCDYSYDEIYEDETCIECGHKVKIEKWD